MKYTKEEIYKILEVVVDPEIPTITLTDLGVITDVIIKDEHVTVKMTPTFSGCPAMDYMQNDVKETLQKNGIDDFEVIMNFDEPWNTNKITPKGIEGIKKHGLAPPQKYIKPEEIEFIQYATCPQCNGQNTELKSTFGPTLCRAFHHCNDCNMLFEQFKTV